MFVSAWLTAGCGLHNAESAFAVDFNCPGATAQATDSPGRYRVNGCVRTATYVCVEHARGMSALQTTEEQLSDGQTFGRRVRPHFALHIQQPPRDSGNMMEAPGIEQRRIRGMLGNRSENSETWSNRRTEILLGHR
jgi:hypothetical protein